ncbi:hypothetical protein [Litorimonas sp. WD9-15]|uniref:hypothetical protein n=1 Tax=Litorimonas sp. WD9-15 TaxID=3418716 RepID=UPI003CFED76E
MVAQANLNPDHPRYQEWYDNLQADIDALNALIGPQTGLIAAMRENLDNAETAIINLTTIIEDRAAPPL